MSISKGSLFDSTKSKPTDLKRDFEGISFALKPEKATLLNLGPTA